MFFHRLQNSWQLVKASFFVLRADKELVIFSIISTLATIIVSITFIVPMALAGAFDSALNTGAIGFFEAATAFLFYFVMYFLVIFSNTALVGAALIRLKGGDPTVADGFRIAFDRVGSIAWVRSRVTRRFRRPLA